MGHPEGLRAAPQLQALRWLSSGKGRGPHPPCWRAKQTVNSEAPMFLPVEETKTQRASGLPRVTQLATGSALRPRAVLDEVRGKP